MTLLSLPQQLAERAFAMAAAPPVGPYFVYEDAQGLFLGRRGEGPLEVVWDTNVLIDYLQHGASMWEGEALNAPDGYLEELEGLALLITLWSLRDIRFHVLPESVVDAKRRLTEERIVARTTAVEELAQALTLDLYADDDELARTDSSAQRDLPLTLPRTVTEDALAALPDGNDRRLVEAAVQRGAHVFLTRDRGVLRCASLFRPIDLLLASPLDLLEHLSACGAILCLMRPEYLYWPCPDLQRVAHLVQALGVHEQ